MHFDPNELTLLYNQNNEKDRKTLAYASTITRKINRQEINSVRVSDTLLEMMLERLHETGKCLLNKSDPYYQEHYRGQELTATQWLDLIKKRPELLRSPVAMYRKKIVVCDTPTDVLKVQ